MNNGFNNGFNNGYQGGYAGMYSGMTYQPSQQKIHMTQGLTPEQLKSLRKTGGFNLEITEEELMRAFCTHRNENSFTVVQDDEGDFICSLCGTKFKPFEGSPAEARDLVDRVVDLLETTKMRALSLPPKTIQDVFQIEPILKRLPDLYSQSINDYKRAMGTDGGYIYGQENNAFAAYQNMVNPMAGNGYFMDPAMAQPMYGAQVQPDMYAQPGFQQPMYGAPQQGYQQPMGGQPMYGAPQQGYQPYGQPGFQQQVENPFQQQPNSGNQQKETETVTVNKTMKD